MPANRVERAAIRVKYAAIELQKVREKNRIAKKYYPQFREFFQNQRDVVLERLEKLKDAFPEESAESKTNAKKSTIYTPIKEWGKIWDSVEADTTADLQDLVVSTEMDGMQAGGDQLGKMLSIDSSKKPGTTFNLANPRAVAWFKKTGGSIDYIKDIQGTTGDSLKTLMTTALDEGWSYSQTGKEIQKLYDEPISRDRAQRIASFESGQAYEAGNRAFADTLSDDGVEMEEMWMTSHDDKVRPEHAANEAEGWVELGHVFSSGDTEPPTDPGCRCFMIYRQKGSGD